MWKILIESLLEPNNIKVYVWLIICLGLLTASGITISTKIWNIKNKLILLSGGMVLGPVGFLFLLEIMSYVLKGPIWLTILFIMYNLLSIPTIKKVDIIHIKKSVLSNAIVFIALLFYGLFFLYVTNAGIIGGDVTTYWTIAASFARGNYPIYTPWQTDFLISYHAGTSILMGALHQISHVGFYSVHFFLSYYFILAIFIFIVGIAREYTKTLLSLIPAILTLVSFGGPVILIGGYQQLFYELNFHNFIESIQKLALVPPFVQFVGVGGNCGSSLGDLVFCNFRTFGIGMLLVFLYTLDRYRKTFTNKEISILTILIIITLSVDESLIPAEVVLTTILFVYKFYKEKNIKSAVKKGLFAACLAVTLFFIVQNPIRDSFLTKRTGEARFTLINKNIHEFESRKNFIKAKEIYQGKSTWHLPGLLLLITIAIALSVVSQSTLIRCITAAGIITGAMSFSVIDYYYPGNGYRFLYVTYNFIMLTFGLVFLKGLLTKNKVIKISVFIILLLLFIPQTVAAHAFLTNQIMINTTNNLTAYLHQENSTLEWIHKNISYKKIVLFVDEYPFNANYSVSTLDALTEYGIATPIGPPKNKTINTELSSEWFDAITTLSPQSLSLLKVNILHIKNNELTRFSEKRQQQLRDKKYFKLIRSFNDANLYEVTSDYKKLKDDELTIQKITEQIPIGATVYIDKFKYLEPRRGLLLHLTKNHKAFGPLYNGGSDYYGHIEFIPKYTITNDMTQALSKNNIRYVLASPETQNEFLQKNYKVIINNKFIIVWEKI